MKDKDSVKRRWKFSATHKANRQILATSNFSLFVLGAFVLAAIGFGIYIKISSYASGFTVSAEAESGTLTGNASVVNDTNASNGSAVKFGGNPATPIACSSRGWAHVSNGTNGTLVSDQNSLLRGGTLWMFTQDSEQLSWATNPTAWARFASYNLNTVRLATGYDSTSAYSLNQYITLLDSQIQQASAHNMYAVIDLHDFASGQYEMSTAVPFWQAVAARYAGCSNVIFELTNEPVSWDPDSYTAQNLKDFEQLYGIVHAAAPKTPVILLTFAVPLNDPPTTNSSPTMVDVANKLTGIDWTNAAVAFHGYWTSTSTPEVNLENSYPAIDTEFQVPCNSQSLTSGLPQDVCQDNTTYQDKIMESHKISWLCWNCNDTSDATPMNDMLNDAEAGGYYWAADK